MIEEVQDSLLNPVDSLIANDSLALSDSIVVADSIVSLPTRMDGVLRNGGISSEAWVFVVLSLAFIILAYIAGSKNGLFRNVKSFFSKGKINETLLKVGDVFDIHYILINVFSVAVFSLMLFEIMHINSNNIEAFLYLTLFFVSYLFLKHILFEMVGNTFFGVKPTRIYKRLYFSLAHIYAILTFPILILNTYLDTILTNNMLIISISILVVLYIILIVKIFQYFHTKAIVLFYIFLYLCTLELLPILALFGVVERFVDFV